MSDSTQNKVRLNLPFYRIDSFADKPFSGNPAAVCLVNVMLEEPVLRAIAAEANLSETAFLFIQDWKSLKQSARFRLRWFTPKVEVPLCGHATLATAAVLFNELDIRSSSIEFETKSGILVAERGKDMIRLIFPSYTSAPYTPASLILEALGIDGYEEALYCESLKKVLLKVRDVETLKMIKPDFQKLKKSVDPGLVQGLILTAEGDEHYDFFSRYFAPWVGINEDPVTGAAHSVLTPYWYQILQKEKMRAYQASARGGIIQVTRLGPGKIALEGKTIVFFRGNIHFDWNQNNSNVSF